jgi:hypothetical protein
MKNLRLAIIAMSALAFSACSDETPVPSPNLPPVQEEVELTRVEKLAQEWTLEKTFENGNPKTENGTERYLFDENGGFYISQNGNWNAMGVYRWVGEDSSAILMSLHGLNTPIIMEIKTLSETALNTEFETSGKTFRYNYVR